MSKLNDILEKLSHVSHHPAVAMREAREQSGREAVGVMPLYAPEEIIHAAGFLPMGMWGGALPIAKARACLPPFACSVMQAVMELQLNGAYDKLKAVVFSVPCDTLKCMSQKWQGGPPSITFTHPQNRKIAAAVPFLVTEYQQLVNWLEKTLKLSIGAQAINDSIEVYNKNRALMRQFGELAALRPQAIDPIMRHAVMKARWFMEKGAHSALMEELNAELEKIPAPPWPGKKVVLSGIMAEPDGLLQVFKDNQLAVVADDLAQESRQFRLDVPPGKDPLERLARWWQDFDGCALATNPLKPRGRMLIDMVRKYQADAVIICMMKFCDPEEFDYPIYYPQLEEAGIQSLLLEVDQEARGFEQIKTRVQTFVDILE